MDGGEPPPADDPARPISDDGAAKTGKALTLAAADGLVAAAGGLEVGVTPAGGLVAAADGLVDARQKQQTPGALGLAMMGAGRLATAGDDGDGQVLDALRMEMAPDVQADQALPIDAVARARSLLPTVRHPAIEYNLPVLQVERSQVNDGENMETVDWTTLHIMETRDDEGRIELMSESQMCEHLGLADEGTPNIHTHGFDRRMDDNELGLDVDGAAIPTNDAVPGEVHISYDKNNPCMEVGTQYPTMEEFKLAVRTYAIKKEFHLGVEKSTTKKYRGFCKSGDEKTGPCQWKINGSKLDNSPTVEVTVLVDKHDCVSSQRIQVTTPSLKWVADRAVDILRVEPTIGTKDLRTRLETNPLHKCTIEYDTVQRGKKRALEVIYGKWSDSFELLFRWKAEVMKRMPGSVVEIDVLEVDGEIYFHRFFCALKPCIDGFLEGCRSHLSVDATALNGRWNGHLAAAIAIDGHNWMYPVAYGFIASETTDNWTWFMQQLKKAIGDLPVLAICSDACKGLENAVKNVFPNAEQRECFYHMVRNFKKRYRGFGMIYPAARAYTKDIFYGNIAKMLSESEAAVQWLRTNHNLLWYRCGFNPEIKCDYITSNTAESFNNWIRDHKDLPVADLADKIREMIMVLWNKRRNIAYRLPEGRILPAIMVQLRANTRGLGHLRVVTCSNWSAEVWDHSSGHSVRHIIKLQQITCTCEEWQHTGKPCPHVLAYVTCKRGVDLEQFVHDYYSVNRFRAAYGREIEPMTDKTQWPQVDLQFGVGAPLPKVSAGRDRKLRFKAWDEGGHKKKGKTTNEEKGENVCDKEIVPTNSKGQKMIRGPMTCKGCGQKGHREASSKCPYNGTAKKGKRRQPRRNVTKEGPAEPSTPRRPTRDEILRDSPGRVTRSKLAMLFGEGTSSQTDNASLVRMPTPVPPKKMTPKRRKLNIG